MHTMENIHDSAPFEAAITAGFPYLIEAGRDVSDCDRWFAAAAPDLVGLLRRTGVLLLRGFPLHGAEDFRRAVAAMTPRLRGYAGGTSPRSRVAEGVYTSTEYPKHLEIPLHNEMSYSSQWPELLYFFCVSAPAADGETPIADSRNILARMPPDIVEEFDRRQLMYVRNLASAESRYNSWTKAFETTDKAGVEAYCRDMDIGYAWQADGGLRIQEVRPALRTHPVTGERVWFNQVHLWHASNTALGSNVTARIESGLPMAAYYGDGGRIGNDTLAAVRQVLNAEKKLFRWQQGDLLMVDNVLSAHGRMPFDGPRQILVAMS
ncbi:MAG TPA: TauD/TfdA family dioxygenase [Duganella sp.]|nr:TauD/TfdA family dioxygenase [Duganella sp.]